MKKSLLNFILVLICLMMTTSLLSIQVAADSPISLEEAKNIVEKWVSETYPLSNEDYNFYVNDWHISPEEIESRYGKVCDVIAENERWIGFELDFIEVVEYYAVNKYSGDVVYITGGHDVGRSKVIQMLESLIDVGDNATISVEVNGVKLSFDQPPVMQNNRVFVPMRAICNALGIEVYWDNNNRTLGESDNVECKITAINGNTLIEICMYNNDGHWIATKRNISDVYGGTSIDIPTEFCPIFVNDRTLLATRFIAELFGFIVDWDDNTSTVYVAGTVNQNHRSEEEMAKMDAFTTDDAFEILHNALPEYNRANVTHFNSATFDEHGKYFGFGTSTTNSMNCYWDGRIIANYGLTGITQVVQEKADYVPVIQEESNKMTTEEFDNGIQKGIDYFNNKMYYEAIDELQWFCDANWERLNPGQREYVLDYLNTSKVCIDNMQYKQAQRKEKKNEYLARYNKIANKKRKYVGAAAYDTPVANAEFNEWDALLNDVYQYLMGVLPKNQADALKADEIAWIARKDASAKSVEEAWGGGNYAHIMWYSEEILQTKDRIKYLLEMI